MKNHYIASDPSMTLAQWKAYIDQLILDFGDNARLWIDAGHNNAQLVIGVEE